MSKFIVNSKQETIFWIDLVKPRTLGDVLYSYDLALFFKLG